MFCKIFLKLVNLFEGQGKPSGYHEQASVVVETVTKTSVMSKFSGLQKFQSDASRCTAEGNGLKKAFRGKQATFSVDTSQAGRCQITVLSIQSLKGDKTLNSNSLGRKGGEGGVGVINSLKLMISNRGFHIDIIITIDELISVIFSFE